MKVVHVYAENIQMFIDAVSDTDIRLNASQDLNYLIRSLYNFNARDVLGLILFANPITKKCLRLVKTFDDLYVFQKTPIILISDNIKGLCARGYFRTKNSKVFCVTSEDNSISDVDLSQIFTTLLVSGGELYDMSVIPAERKKAAQVPVGNLLDITLSDQLQSVLKIIEEAN